MFKKKFRRKSNKKIRGRGFGDGFKLLYSLGKQWRKSMNEAQKELCDGKAAGAKKGDFTQW